MTLGVVGGGRRIEWILGVLGWGACGVLGLRILGVLDLPGIAGFWGCGADLGGV